jgi:stage II sporulation protein D
VTHTPVKDRPRARWLLALMLATLTVMTPGTARAATGPEVSASVTGPTTINPEETTTLTATYSKNGVAVPSANLRLQKLYSSGWTTVRLFKVQDGVGTTTLAPNRTASYRVVNYDGQAISTPVDVTVLTYYVHAELTGPSVITSSGSTRLGVKYVKPSGPVAAATVRLQKLYSSGWSTVRKVEISDGVGSTTLAPNRTARYRVVNYNGSRISRTIEVVVKDPLPTSFTIHGSGFGHGVGMPQYGAYGAAREGMKSTEILEYFYTGTDVRTVDTKSLLAVQVLGPEPYGYSGYGDARTATALNLVSGGSWRIRDNADSHDPDAVHTEAGSIALRIDGGQVVADDGRKTVQARKLRVFWSGTRDWTGNGVKAVVRIGSATSSSSMHAQGLYRHGYFEIGIIDGKLNIVNVLRLNTEYLYGLSEMPSSWGQTGGRSALAAQAIAGRSYALTKTSGRNAGCDCHVVDDVRDQNFTGWRKENEGSGVYGAVWVDAVDATVTDHNTARVLTYGGDPIRTHYYSSSGGYTADSEDVWSSVIPWERSVKDPWSMKLTSYASWTRKLSQAQAQALFGLADIRSISVTRRWTGGLARELTATSASGAKATVSGKADWMRWKISNYTDSSLPAVWISTVD